MTAVSHTAAAAVDLGLVEETFGVRLSTTSASAGLSVAELVHLALRRNPRRAHLLVSTVLGKHLPIDPRVAVGAGRLLGELVGRMFDGTAGLDLPESLLEAAQHTVSGDDPGALLRALPPARRPDHPLLVLGYAETATSLGHLVADQLGAPWYLHSTRRAVPGVPVAGTFEEGHSHATSHLLLPVPASLLDGDGPLVLVDDEISTGHTAIGTIAELHRRRPRGHYVVACLIDLRSPESEAEMVALATELGVRIDVVSLARGAVVLPEGLTATVAAWIGDRAGGNQGTPNVGDRVGDTLIDWVELPWPVGLPDGGRHGWPELANTAAEAATAGAADHLRSQWGQITSVLVLGTEEFMYLPLRIAEQLAIDPSLRVTFQSTTRSPVHPVAVAGYPIRRGFGFHSIDTDDETERFVYNVSPPDGSDPDVVVVMADAAVDRERLLGSGGLVAALQEAGLRVVVASLRSSVPVPVPLPLPLPLQVQVQVPLPQPLTGPSFGSYQPQEVSWLLTDLSHLDLEGAVADREKRIQSGQAHYAESLPVEFQPDIRYRELFEEVLNSSAPRLARAVGVVTELVLAERGQDITLVSLARAGTPIGILMRRWAAARHGLDLQHFAVSIVRGRGIDRVALNYLAAHTDPASVVFIDGWTGKGAIARELTAALAEVKADGGPEFNDDLAVLADPGHCVRTFGTRDDFLIASACLNSTVSGLVSRTVLNPLFLRPDQFHGAKFYRELASTDVSERLLDAVSEQFSAVAADVAAELPTLAASDREPTFAGWAAVERIREEYQISSVNFVKPGVGETTRVLLRRVPWRILLRENNNPDHHHLRLLATERSVPIEIRPDLPYSCVGLIRPMSATDRGEG